MTDFTVYKDNFSRYDSIESQLVYGEPDKITPLFSIMTPTYRRPSTLIRAVRSALEQKNSDAVPYEVVIVDNDADGNEETDKMALDLSEQHPNFLYYRNKKNLGMFGNWNRCLELARGKWVCMLHDDDMLHEDYIARIASQLEGLECGVAGVFPCFAEETDSGFQETEKCRKANKIKRIICKLAKGAPIKITVKDYRRNIMPNATGCIFNKAHAVECGGFNEELNVDYTFYALLGMKHGAYLIPEMLTYRGISECNLSNDVATITEYARTMKAFSDGLRKQMRTSFGWVSGYSAASYIDNNRQKYNDTLKKTEICAQIGLSAFWKHMPHIFLRLMEACFWLSAIYLSR